MLPEYNRIYPHGALFYFLVLYNYNNETNLLDAGKVEIRIIVNEIILMNKTKKGFTLIELLVVIAIIGILSSIVIASLNNARKKSRDARRVADIKQVQLALEMYFDTNRAYPLTLGALVTGGHIASEPKDPIGVGVVYAYAYSPAANPTYYHLGASLEESTNLSLSSDKDCNSGGITCPAGVVYNGVPFPGDDGAKCLAAHAGNSCYDVVP